MNGERSDAIDRRKEHNVGFADWIHDFYVAVTDYKWVSIYRPGEPKTTSELYDVYTKIQKQKRV